MLNIRLSYLKHGNSHTWERQSLYQDGALWVFYCLQVCFLTAITHHIIDYAIMRPKQ